MSGPAHKAVKALGAGRVLVGVALCAAPSVAARWTGDAPPTAGARMVTRAMGVRDAALGIGTLASLGETAHLRRWLLASSACDAADFMITLGGPRSPARSLVLGLAAAAVAAGVATAASV